MPQRFDLSKAIAPKRDAPVKVLGIDTGYRYFGPGNEVGDFKVGDFNRPQYETYARRHDLDVESAMKIKNTDRRKDALDRADAIFMKNMDKIGLKYPKEWLMSRVFKTGLQKYHYKKYE